MYQQCGIMKVYSNFSDCASFNNSSVVHTVSHVRLFEKIIELYLISILCVFGLVGNSIAVLVLRRDRERREALFLLQALAFADAFYLIIAVLRYPLKYLLNNERTYFTMQLTVFPLLKTAQAMTIWMMLLVTTDRYIYVCRPLVAHQLCNSRTRRALSVFVLLMAFVYNLPRFFDSCVMSFQDMCTGLTYNRMVYTPPFNNNYYYDIYQYAAYLLLLYVGPLSVLIVLNYKLLAAIRRSRRRQRQFTLQPTSQHVLQSETNASIVLIIVVIVFVICETPELVLKVLTIIIRHMPQLERIFSRNLVHTCTVLSELLMVLNSSINFLIYCAFGRRFRHIMRETFKRSFSHTTMVTHESIPMDVFKKEERLDSTLLNKMQM